MPPEVHQTRKVQTVPTIELADLDYVNDCFYVLDKSDTTDDPAGTFKRVSVEEVVSGIGGGTSFTSGAGAPSGGDAGDWYLRTSNMHLYQNVASVWTAMGQLVPIA